MPYTSVLSPLLRKLEARATLTAHEREAVVALPYRTRTVDRGNHFVREGEQSDRCSLLLTGYAIRHKITSRGARQIVSMHLPGDFVDLQGAVLNVADHNVEGMTICELATISRIDVITLAAKYPAISLALWLDTLIDGSIFREWVVNVGRRDATSRIAHILCEFALRSELVGLGAPSSFEMPMTQEQLADASGLTAVHVNRTLRGLDRSGVVERSYRRVEIKDWDALCELGDFNPNYLHLHQLADHLARIAPSIGLRSTQ